MAAIILKNQAKTLETYRIALENSVNVIEISTILNEYNYDAEKITEGKTLLEKARIAYDTQKIENDEKLSSYIIFNNQKEELENIFKNHRKKAKIIFRNDKIAQIKLGLKNKIPNTYINWLELIKKFYLAIINNKEIQDQISIIKITVEEATEIKSKILNLDKSKSNYIAGKSIKEASTTKKHQEILKIERWMNDFYAISKIAFEDNPQLLEALGKVIK